MASGYYRFPTIHNNTVVFVCEDDLWSVPAEGGIARRLTSNLGEVSRPSLSPNGEWLAFVGREEGQSEIYRMPAVGGAAQRLTFLGGTNCLTAGWESEQKILFASNAGHWYLRFTHLYSQSMDGSEPKKLTYGLARAIAFGPQGGVLLGRHTDDPARWKRYRGGTAGQLWIDRQGGGEFIPLLPELSNLASPLWLASAEPEGRIYFISDHEGIGNLYSCAPDGSALRRHTHHQDYYVRNASSDGRRIVYHAGADLFLFDPLFDRSEQIQVEFHSPQVQRNRKFVSAASQLQEWSLHPKGHSLAVTSRGKVFTFANWEGAVLEHGDFENHAPAADLKTGVRWRLPIWLNDGKRLLAVNDAGGEEAFVLWNCDGTGTPERLEGLDIGRLVEIKVNPKKDQVAFSNHRYELLVLDLEKRELRVIDRARAFPFIGFNWSPDGEWLAYSLSTSVQVISLRLWQASSGEIHPLARPVLRDVEPAFDPAGKYLYFIGYRTFDPIYDNMQFDLNFPMGMKPYLITLQKDSLSPFIPQPKLDDEKEKDEDKPDEQKDEAEDRQAEGDETDKTDTGESSDEQKDKEEKDKKEEEKPVQIDLEGIENRVLAFPVTEGLYGRILGARDGKVYYVRYPTVGAVSTPDSPEPQGRGTLFTYNFDDQKEETVTVGVWDFAVARNHKTLAYQSFNRLRVMPSGDKPNGDDAASTRKSGWINLGRVRISVLPGLEWRQMFREAWRLQRDQFWTPDMSQVDWVGVHDRYLPLVDRVSSRAEFSDLMWEMQGELGTSHAYEFGGDYRIQPVYFQGFLGADFTYNETVNAWEISHIYSGDGWNEGEDSPLNQPGVNLAVGDKIATVNGRRLNRFTPPGAALVNQAGSEVTLGVYPANGEESQARSVTVKTLGSDMMPRYREWVETNRSRVHAATDGRIGYLHIPDMGGWGYAEFHRGFLAEVDRQGLLVDLRFNRGGHVSALLLQKLARRRLGYDTTRWSSEPYPYPPESVLGPMVALTNEYAGSDGDIFSHGFKMMKLGKLIGKRTWGGVIGIWPRHLLVDGTLTTQPEFSFWFQDVGWGVENYGTDPDIEVDIRPQDYQAGTDPQLERAIVELLSELAAQPPSLPDFSQKPSRAIPRLPQA